MDQLHTANKVCGGCCAISLNTVDTESSVSPIIDVCYIFNRKHEVFYESASFSSGIYINYIVSVRKNIT